MAKQAGVRALFLTESLGHLCIGDVVCLVITGAKQQRIHDAWHVAGNTTAAFGSLRVMRMLRCPDAVLKLPVTSGAHQVGVIAKF